MVFEGWKLYARLFSKLQFSNFPGWMRSAIYGGGKFDSSMVKQLCGAYFESLTEERTDRNLDSYVLLKFARNCTAARDAITKEAAGKKKLIISIL